MTDWHEARRRSEFLEAIESVAGKLRASVTGSRFVASLAGGRQTFRTAVFHSGPGRSWRRLQLWTSHSRLLTWLQSEPGTRQIVVGLEDATTARLLLTFVRRVRSTVGPSWNVATVRGVFLDGADEIERAPVRAVSVVLLTGLIVNTVLQTAFGSLSTADHPVRVVVALLALLGLRVDASWDDLETSPVLGTVLRGIRGDVSTGSDGDESEATGET